MMIAHVVALKTPRYRLPLLMITRIAAVNEDDNLTDTITVNNVMYLIHNC